MKNSEIIKIYTLSILSFVYSFAAAQDLVDGKKKTHLPEDFILHEWDLSADFNPHNLYSLEKAVETVHKIAGAETGQVDEFTSTSEKEEGQQKAAEKLSGRQIGLIYPCSIKYLSEEKKFNTYNLAKPIKRAKFYKVDVVSELALQISESGNIISRDDYRVQNVFGAQSNASNVVRVEYSVGFSGVRNNGGLIRLLPDPYKQYYGAEAIVRSLVPMEGSQAREQKDDLACALVVRLVKPYFYTYEHSLTGGGGVVNFKGKGIYGDIVGQYVFNRKTNMKYETIFR